MLSKYIGLKTGQINQPTCASKSDIPNINVYVYVYVYVESTLLTRQTGSVRNRGQHGIRLV